MDVSATILFTMTIATGHMYSSDYHDYTSWLLHLHILSPSPGYIDLLMYSAGFLVAVKDNNSSQMGGVIHAERMTASSAKTEAAFCENGRHRQCIIELYLVPTTPSTPIKEPTILSITVATSIRFDWIFVRILVIRLIRYSFTWSLFYE